METADHQMAANTSALTSRKTTQEQIDDLRADMQEYVISTTRLLERIVSDMNEMEHKIIMLESDHKI